MIDIMNNETWERLQRGASGIPDNWNRRVEESIRRERREVEKRYGVRFGQTELTCDRCGRPWGFEHVCRDIYFQGLREKKERAKALKNESNIDVGGILTHTEYIMASAPQF